MKQLGIMLIGLGLGFLVYVALNLASVSQQAAEAKLLFAGGLILVGVIMCIIPSRSKRQ